MKYGSSSTCNLDKDASRRTAKIPPLSFTSYYLPRGIFVVYADGRSALSRRWVVIVCMVIQSGSTSLHVAAAKGATKTIQVLLNWGADVHAITQVCATLKE